jgi:very-short-patch-repair endonuclease
MNTETVARVLAALARNDGHLTVTSANEAGINRKALKRAADAGILLHTGWGQYADPALPKKQILLRGAHLGTEAVLSHRGGGHFFGLDAMTELVLEWSIPHEMKSTGRLIHRRRRFGELEVVEFGGILVTSPAQTLADLGAVVDADVVERAVESWLRRHPDQEALLREFAVSRTRSRHGGPTLRQVLSRRRPGERATGSDEETIAMQTLRPYFDVRRQWAVWDERDELIGYGDLALPPFAFILEVDGTSVHHEDTRQYDYSRHARIEDVGYRIRRVTASDVRARPSYVRQVVERGVAGAPLLSQLSPKFRVPPW